MGAAEPLGFGRVQIPGELTIYTAREWRDRLMAVVEKDCDMELDLSEVSEVDGAGIQLLVALQMELQTKGHSLHMSGVSSRVMEAFQFCRLTEFFMDALPG
jgi:anti-sigma B factor antagonist